jgi:hypothetical protein
MAVSSFCSRFVVIRAPRNRSGVTSMP